MVILRLLSSRGGEPDDMQRQIMVIPHLFAIRRRSSPMARRDKLWSFCAFCHLEAVNPMTCRDKLWSLCTFCHPDLIVSDGMQRQIMVILCPSIIPTLRSCDMQRQIMAIPHTFLPFGDNRVRWHVETNYGHSAPFFHPEAVSLTTCGDKLWSFCTFCHPNRIVSDGTQRQIMVILCPSVILTLRTCDMRRKIMIIPHTFSPFGDNRV